MTLLTRRAPARHPALASAHLVFKDSLHRIRESLRQPIPAPQNKAVLRRELMQADHLGQTSDGKVLFLCDTPNRSPLLKEIGRLREITFRAVGEGSGKRRDIDAYDYYYRHLVLWDVAEEEIIGCYRLGETREIVKTMGVAGLYSHALFEYQSDLKPLLLNAIELGRSFIQTKYWGSRALDQLWQGIGLYLQQQPDVRWLFGPVSISNQLAPAAKQHLVYFYRRWFASERALARARMPFPLDQQQHEVLAAAYPGFHYQEEFRALRRNLLNLGASVPTLYKQYVESFAAGGITFADFSIDPSFACCVDGLMLADLSKLKPEKRLRYLDENGAALCSALRSA